MTERELEEAILKLLSRIAPEVDPKTVDRDEPLQQALDIDSFDFLNLLVAVRDELGITVNEADYEKVSTLSGMVHFLASKMG